MRLGIDSKREALEALRAVENWAADTSVCVTDEIGTIRLHIRDAVH